MKRLEYATGHDREVAFDIIRSLFKYLKPCEEVEILLRPFIKLLADDGFIDRLSAIGIIGKLTISSWFQSAMEPHIPWLIRILGSENSDTNKRSILEFLGRLADHPECWVVMRNHLQSFKKSIGNDPNWVWVEGYLVIRKLAEHPEIHHAIADLPCRPGCLFYDYIVHGERGQGTIGEIFDKIAYHSEVHVKVNDHVSYFSEMLQSSDGNNRENTSKLIRKLANHPKLQEILAPHFPDLIK